MTVMGAALSAAVMPVTRVPVTITDSVSAWATSWASDGAASAARTMKEVPSNRDALDFERYDMWNPRVFRLGEVGLVPSRLFPLAFIFFCAVQDIGTTV